MFRVKICGITSVEDAQTAARAGADAIGLNFYAKSPRRVELPLARQIIEALPGGVVKVGVFVNALPEEVRRTFDEVGLDLVQLHGDEPPELLGDLGARPVLRAFRLGRAGLEPVRQYLELCRALGWRPRMILFDAQVAGVYGGSGQTLDWDALAGRGTDLPPAVLAGGLRPENVAEAVRRARPYAVDTASGVELSPGRKSPERVAEFVLRARQALGCG